MKKSPSIAEVSQWLRTENPLDLFGGRFSIIDIDPKSWSGHFNFLIRVKKKKFVLRFKGPEWGRKKGILSEYRTLKKLEKYRIGPKVFYFTNDFFNEQALLEEYFEGKPFSSLNKSKQLRSFPEISAYAAKINSIPFSARSFSFEPAMLSFKKNLRAYRVRVDFIIKQNGMRICGKKLRSLMPGIEKLLMEYEKTLKEVLKESGPSFIFESAHVGHLLMTKRGPRFLNWEQVSYGDPSYTLAVFLTSISTRRNFFPAKDIMVESYLKKRKIPFFQELVQNRINERKISNAIWIIQNEIKKGNRKIRWQKQIRAIEKVLSPH